MIPMAGLGSRFSSAGYQIPKPLLPIHGVPMYQIVLANLFHPSIETITLACPRSWDLAAGIKRASGQLGIPINLIEVDSVTDGPARTVALAAALLDPSSPVVTANSDQYLDASLGLFYSSLAERKSEGLVLCMKDDDPKWSYVQTSSDGRVTKVREKEVISNQATVGVYGFASAALMLEAFDSMFRVEDRTNGEFYVAPSYNHLISRGCDIRAIGLGEVGSIMHGLGVPDDYEAFMGKAVSKRASRAALDYFVP